LLNRSRGRADRGGERQHVADRDAERQHDGIDVHLFDHDDHYHRRVGVVTGGPESVTFSGQAKVSADVVTDPDFGGIPTVVLTIDLSSLKGVGASTGAKYVTSDQGIVQRRLAAGDSVQYTFPFYQSGTSPLAPRVGLASFNLSIDVNTLKLTGVSGSIGSP
jgi:hypothetical protein